MPVAVGDCGGVVARSDGKHVLKRPRPQLRQAVDFHGASVGDQNQFRAFEHEDPGAFGELPIVANHRADLDRPASCIEFGNMKIVPGRQIALDVEVASVHFRVDKLSLAEFESI